MLRGCPLTVPYKPSVCCYCSSKWYEGRELKETSCSFFSQLWFLSASISWRTIIDISQGSILRPRWLMEWPAMHTQYSSCQTCFTEWNASGIIPVVLYHRSGNSSGSPVSVVQPCEILRSSVATNAKHCERQSTPRTMCSDVLALIIRWKRNCSTLSDHYTDVIDFVKQLQSDASHGARTRVKDRVGRIPLNYYKRYKAPCIPLLT